MSLGARVGTFMALLPVAAVALAASVVDERARFTLRVEAERDGRRFGVGSGARLRSGDHLQMFVGADRDVFVQVIQYFADGGVTVLYPLDESGFLPAGVTLRIPREGYWLRLDEAVGEEHVYFVVSTQPLSEVDEVVAGAVERIRASAGATAPPQTLASARSPAAGRRTAPPVSPGPPAASTATGTSASAPAERPGEPAPAPPADPGPPQGFGLVNRGLVRVAGPEGAVVELDEAGLAIHRFWFFHDPF